ncbi:MAG: histidine phosphatase family protein [Deltaproteobacteria bacterium]|nr:histidine phosphatase family protein [Deltaproteobacteria bacterium]MBW2307692.1 histidine phosphatase family protein [Deltaproteobacteria bacterium]
MTHIYLVRHAESSWNPIKRLQGVQDPPLSVKGRQQAKRVGQRFRDIRLDAIYSSNLTRAFQTAEAIARATGLSVVVEEGLQEISFGEWEGMLIPEVDLDGYHTFLEYWVHRVKYQPVSGSESLETCRDRMVGAISRIIQRHSDGSVAVVSHGSALSLFFQYVLETPLENMWRMQPNNCSISLVTAKKRELKMNFYNDTCHLEDRP